MKATIKSGFAVLVAALVFLSPVGVCAAMFKTAAAPAHHCCPKPAHSTCEKPSCVCVSTEAPTLAIQSIGSDTEAIVMPVSADLPPVALRRCNATSLEPSSSNHRLVALHQFLI